MRHSEVTLREVFAVLDCVNGKPGVQAMSAGREFAEVPPIFADETLGQVGALYQKMGPEIAAALRRDEVELVMQEPTKVIVRQKEQLMVDADGRFVFRNIPQVKPANWEFGFDQSIQPSYSEVLERLEYTFEREIGISASEFENRAESKKAEIMGNPLYANLFQGRYSRPFAIALPQMEIPKKGGLGELLARTIIPAAKLGYARKYPERQFNDCCGGALIGQTEAFLGSRQERLIAALAEGPQVLWVFLNCLQGAAFNAARILIQTLPEEFILGGALVNAPVIAAYPEIAAASGQCPLYFCAADIFRRGDSFHLDPRDGRVRFGDWFDLGLCFGGCSASVAGLA